MTGSLKAGPFLGNVWGNKMQSSHAILAAFCGTAFVDLDVAAETDRPGEGALDLPTGAVAGSSRAWPEAASPPPA